MERVAETTSFGGVDVPVPVTVTTTKAGPPLPNDSSTLLEVCGITMSDLLHLKSTELEDLADEVYAAGVTINGVRLSRMILRSRLRQLVQGKAGNLKVDTPPVDPVGVRTTIEPPDTSERPAAKAAPSIVLLSTLASASEPRTRSVDKIIFEEFTGRDSAIPISVWLRRLALESQTQSLSQVEAWRLARRWLASPVRDKVTNYLVSQGLASDDRPSDRLMAMDRYLRQEYTVTDNPSRHLAALQALRQGGRPVEEFSVEFDRLHGHLMILGYDQGQHVLLRWYREGLDFAYMEASRMFVSASPTCTHSELASFLHNWEADLGRKVFRSKKAGANQVEPTAQEGKTSADPKGLVRRDHGPDRRELRRKGICFDYIEGKCTRDNCRFKHQGLEQVAEAVDVKRVSVGIASSERTRKADQMTTAPPLTLKVKAQWSIPLRIGNAVLEGLPDSGAAVNLMSETQAERLAAEGIGSFGRLRRPVPLAGYNGAVELCSRVFQVPVSLGSAGSVPRDHVFLLCKRCEPTVLLGRDFIDEVLQGCVRPPFPAVVGVVGRNSPDVEPSTCGQAEDAATCEGPDMATSDPGIQAADALVRLTSDGRIEIGCPVLEKARVYPFRDAPRDYSTVKSAVIKHCLENMVMEGCLEKVSTADATMIHQVVLCDKWKDTPKFRPLRYPLADDEASRFRVTADMRPCNSLHLDRASGVFVLPSEFVADSKIHSPYQCEADPLRVLAGLAPNQMQFFGKIDLKAAYHSVRAAVGLRRLWAVEHLGVTYRYVVLPQGWRWSPALFDRALDFVLEEVRPRLPGEVVVIHKKDDILVVAAREASCLEAMESLEAGLQAHGFIPQPEKREGPARQVHFCGHLVTQGGLIRPQPRRDVSAALVSTFCERIKKCNDPDDLKTAIRSWLGVMNFASRWLVPAARNEVNKLYKWLQLLNTSGSCSLVPKEELIASVRQLGEHYCNLPFALYAGARVATLVVSDANSGGWAATCLAVVPVSTDIQLVDPTPLGLQMVVKGILGKVTLPDLGADQHYIVLPIGFLGGRWTDAEVRLRSSTWRERVGCLRAISGFGSQLVHPTYLGCDNLNVARQWREHLSPGLMPAFELMCEVVSGFFHLKRTHATISTVDQLARVLAGDPHIEELICDTTGPLEHIQVLTADVGDTGNTTVRDRPRRSGTHWTPAQTFRQQRLAAGQSISSHSESGEEAQVGTPYDHVGEADEDSANEEPADGVQPTLPIEWAEFVRAYEASDAPDLRHFRRAVSGAYYSTDEATLDFLLVPQALRARAVEHLHNIGHPGVAAFRDMLAAHKLLIPSWRQLLAENPCTACQMAKPSYAPPFSAEPRGSPSESILSLDFAHFSEERGWLAIVMREHSSGFVDALPVPTTDTASALLGLGRFISAFGPPAAVFTDNAKCFRSEEMRSFCDLWAIRQMFSPPGHPQSHGGVERMIRVLNEALRACLAKSETVSFATALCLAVYKINMTGSHGSRFFRGLAERTPRPPFVRVASGFEEPVESKGQLAVGSRVLEQVRVSDKMDVRFMDYGRQIHSRVGRNCYRLEGPDATLVPGIRHRSQLKLLLASSV